MASFYIIRKLSTFDSFEYALSSLSLLISSKNAKEVGDCFAFSKRKVSKLVMSAFSNIALV